MNKTATTRFPIHELLAERWSPIAFQERGIEVEKLGSLLEAARWAASSFNEQPWSFLVGAREDAEGYARLAACLMEGNAWAKKAPLLVLTAAKLSFDRNGKPNRHAWHDVGMASANLVMQAQAVGLSAHMMAGFDAERATGTLDLPDGWEPVAMIAIGYRAEVEALPEAMRARESAPRSRKELDSIVHGARWGQPLAALGNP